MSHNKWAVANKHRGKTNKTEQRYGQRLETLRLAGEVRAYLEHAVTVRLADGCRYEPDYLVVAADGVIELHEVKGSAGWQDPKSRVKWKAAGERHPWFRFVSAVERKKRDGGGWEVETYQARVPFPAA